MAVHSHHPTMEQLPTYVFVHYPWGYAHIQRLCVPGRGPTYWLLGVDLVETTSSAAPYLCSGLASIDLAHFCRVDMDTGLAIAGDMAHIRRIKVRYCPQ